MAQEGQAWLETLGESGPFEGVESCPRLAPPSAAHALMGIELRQRLDEPCWRLVHDLVASVDAGLPPALPRPRFLRRARARRRMPARIRPLLAERRSLSGTPREFLPTLVEARYADGRPWTAAVLVRCILSRIVAGHDTTSGQASWSWIHLLPPPESLCVVLEEHAHTLPPGRPLPLETLRPVPPLLWALRETERPRPAAGLLMRSPVESSAVGGSRVPAGWGTLLSPPLAHRLPEAFPEPARYEPWRFAPERAEERQHRFALVGFGGGGHKCLGIHCATNEMAVIMRLLLPQYPLERLTPDPHPRREKRRAARLTPCWIRSQRR
jgi:sterol 14-demethylase